ncbi:MAG TPA: APC family permease [Candidatus Acidoferrum sp.]|nr:APC family permease [Candidatus Acidoferrum sp.]
MKGNKLTLWPLIAAVYLMVAGGPFGLEDTVSQMGYQGAILILLITPVIWALPAALMVAELASALPEEGGFYVWARRAMGPFGGFMEAWLTLVGSIFDMAIYPTLFVSYLEHFNPAITAHGRGFWIGVAMIGACALLNVGGVKSVGVSSFAFTALLLTPFAVLSFYAAAHPAPMAPHAPVHYDFLLGMLVAMWNYMGFDNSSPVAAEVDRPQRTYPLAMAGAILIVVFTYVGPIAAVAATGLPAANWTTGAWPDVARTVFGGGAVAGVLAAAITIGGMIGAFGTCSALTMSLSRLPMVLAEDGFLPKIFARRHARTGAPTVAIFACALVWALAMNLSFSKLIILDVLLTGLSILMEFASLIVLRVREPELPRPYRVPGGMAGAIGIAIGPTVLLVMAVVRNKAEPVGPINALQLGAILIALGVLAYFLSKHDRR